MISFDKNRKPDFENVKKILACQRPNRPTLFEIFISDSVLSEASGVSDVYDVANRIKAFEKLGYDYTSIYASKYAFKNNSQQHDKQSISLNSGAIIKNRADYEKYVWESPDDYYEGYIENASKYLPDGMKFIIIGPGGVLENVISIMGYDNLCYLIADDPELVGMIFEQVGRRIIRYYERIINIDSVGAIVSNDDWGFNTQTMLSPSDMRKYVFPYHKEISNLAKSAKKPTILHSCGNLREVYNDIIYDIGYNAKHSYEDKIMPVEQAYEMLKGKIAVVGGIDVDFLCRKSPEEIYNRAKSLISQTNCVGYGLGSGNSIPNYVPVKNYLSMIKVVFE